MSKEDNPMARPIKSTREIFNEKKKAFTRRLFWGALSMVGIVILVGAFILIYSGSCGNQKKRETESTAIKALKMKTGDKKVLKVLAISDPDSVFVNRMCPEAETMELSERFLEYSLNIMRTTQPDIQAENKAYRCQMDRFAESSTSLNTLNTMLEKPQGPHCGWRVKVRYQTVDDSDTPYVSEVWYIFDKEQKHILNSFDICLL